MANSTASYNPENIPSNTYGYDQIKTMWAEVKDIYNTLTGTSSYSDIPSQKRYVAYLDQQNLAHPTATVLFNNTGVTPIFTRSKAGHYWVTASGLFTATSQYVTNLPYEMNLVSSSLSSGSLVYAGRSGSDNAGYISVMNLSGGFCDSFNHLLFEVIV